MEFIRNFGLALLVCLITLGVFSIGAIVLLVAVYWLLFPWATFSNGFIILGYYIITISLGITIADRICNKKKKLKSL